VLIVLNLRRVLIAQVTEVEDHTSLNAGTIPEDNAMVVKVFAKETPCTPELNHEDVILSVICEAWDG
jgi:hypothetical protein